MIFLKLDIRRKRLRPANSAFWKETDFVEWRARDLFSFFFQNVMKKKERINKILISLLENTCLSYH